MFGLRAARIEIIRGCIRYKEIPGTERFYPGLDPGFLQVDEEVELSFPLTIYLLQEGADMDRSRLPILKSSLIHL